MLNLLFISDSPKIESVKKVLQPVLKVIIDVVTDFDQGLKDVFEKRPTTVCIQDQIGGVTGESVARHIQMLLGKGAPTFILMHEGNPKARPIRGLFELMIDLSQPDDVLLQEIKSTFKVLLGDQWTRVYMPPVAETRPDRSALVIPLSSRAEATKLVDDLLADLDTSAVAEEQSDQPEPTTLANASDEIADMMLAQSRQARQQEEAAKTAVVKACPSAPVAILNPDAPPASQTVHAPAPETPRTAPVVPSPLSGLPQKPAEVKSISESAPLLSPAGFQIRRDSAPEGDLLPEELLFTFDQSYRSGSFFLKRSTIIVALVLVCLASAGWYATVNRPQLTAALQQRIMSLSGQKRTEPKPSMVAPPLAAPVPPAQHAVVPHSGVAEALPGFIPQAGRDGSYSSQHPGWERYLSAETDFRLFRAGTEIKAVQVLAAKNRSIPDKVVRSVLKEFTGSAEYQIVSQTRKQGILILSGSGVHKADIKIYKKNGSISAFVVSRH